MKREEEVEERRERKETGRNAQYKRELMRNATSFFYGGSARERKDLGQDTGKTTVCIRETQRPCNKFPGNPMASNRPACRRMRTDKT